MRLTRKSIDKSKHPCNQCEWNNHYKGCEHCDKCVNFSKFSNTYWAYKRALHYNQKVGKIKYRDSMPLSEWKKFPKGLPF